MITINIIKNPHSKINSFLREKCPISHKRNFSRTKILLEKPYLNLD